eukprot:CAMPEP_0168419978 /NCGR_PEP_ID=MMETSP0228-20121227/32541_1 /TAXON_ID=133427 /ORGANISM="Protoceratium reticulatum, Strain CCCM 535 (=CCMP 1889)" /LENGTH=224 /DNA_ID=CAMNT_0008433865 /DNA_START=1 /DNA_END=672 /DNA_ORIENTATION=-
MLFTSGDERLGGDDFDDALATWAEKRLMPHLKDEKVRAWPLTPHNRMHLRLVARRVKERLSSSESVDLEFLGAKLTITRGDFNIIVMNTLQRLLLPIREASYGARVRLPFESLAVETYGEAQKRQKKTKKQEAPDPKEQKLDKMRKRLGVPTSDAAPDEPLVDEVLCVGAASWTTSVRELLQLITGCKPTVSMVKVFSSWRAAWTGYVLKRPDLIERMKKEGAG